MTDAAVTRGSSTARTWAGPGAALLLALGAAVGGAFLTGTDVGTATGGVESLSARSGGVLELASMLLPFGFAFSAGMVATVNPCGFAMLPAYLGLFLGERGEGKTRGTRPDRALLVGLSVTAGFVLMFGLVGFPITLGARGLVGAFPWVALAVGLTLAVAGAWLLAGGTLYSGLAARLATRVGNPAAGGVRGYFAFGLAYGLASLSCTLPIFIAVIGGTFTAGTAVDSVLQFALYGLGMGSVILALTFSMALFRGALVGVLRRALPYASAAGALLLVLAGAFIVYYWLSLGGLLERITGGTA